LSESLFNAGLLGLGSHWRFEFLQGLSVGWDVVLFEWVPLSGVLLSPMVVLLLSRLALSQMIHSSILEWLISNELNFQIRQAVSAALVNELLFGSYELVL